MAFERTINERCKRAVEALLDALPGVLAVTSIKYTVERDWSGDPCINFRIVIPDNADRNNVTPTVCKLLDYLTDADELGYLTYFAFRTESECEQLKDPQWDRT